MISNLNELQNQYFKGITLNFSYLIRIPYFLLIFIIAKYKIHVLQQKIEQVSPVCEQDFCQHFGKRFWKQIKADIAGHESCDFANGKTMRTVEAWWSKFKV